jgi:hypothetical protein
MNRPTFMDRSAHLLTVTLFLLLGVSLPAQGWISKLTIEPHQPGSPLEISLTTSQQPDWITLFVREGGSGDFIGLAAETLSNGQYRFLLALEKADVQRIDCYVAARVSGQVVYHPESAPDSFQTLNITKVLGDRQPSAPASTLPTATDMPASPASLSMHVNLSGSADHRLMEKTESGEDIIHHQHQMGLQMAYSQNSLQFNLRTRVGYSDQAFVNGDKFDLADLSASMRIDRHHLEVGDLGFSESEFSISAMGRRGAVYSYQGPGLNLRTFILSSQQMGGLRGLGIPDSETGLFGGSLGYRDTANNCSLIALFLTGKDDPSKGISNGFTPYYKAREGSLFAFYGHANLLRNQLNISGEAAFSKADRDLDDAIEAQNGLAWRAQAAAQFGGLRINTFYRQIDKTFDTIGQPFFTPDRRSFGIDGTFRLGLTDLGASYQNDQSGLEAQNFDPTQSYLQSILSRNRQAQVYLNLMAGSRLSLRLAGSMAWQEAEQDNQILPSGELKRTGVILNLSWTISPSAALSLSGGVDRLGSDTALDKRSNAFNLQLGSTINSGVLSLNPGVSYNRLENPQTDTVTTLLGAFTSGRLMMIRDILSLDFTGSYNTMDSGQLSSTTAMVDGGLMLESGQLIPFGRLGISLRGSFSLVDSFGLNTSDYRLYLRADYAIN